MIGSRARIVFLTMFFSFSFAMLFLALAQNYVRAEISNLAPVRIVAVGNSDIQPIVAHNIFPSFGLIHTSLAQFDFDSDDSFQKFLHDEHPFDDLTYAPTDLLPINSNFTANMSKAFKLREEAGIHFADMAWYFRNAFSGDKLYIVSAYRSSGLQWYLIKQWCTLMRCAKVGTSEHQAWLAVDLKVMTKWWKWYSLDVGHPNKYYDWLKSNAHMFWFHNTYQKWIEVDGKIAEWRHRRYMWKELATILMEHNQTFAEYYFDTDK